MRKSAKMHHGTKRGAGAFVSTPAGSVTDRWGLPRRTRPGELPPLLARSCSVSRLLRRRELMPPNSRPRKPGSARKVTGRRKAGRKAPPRRAAARKTAARKTAGRKSAGRKPAAHRTLGRKAAERKKAAAARRTLGRKTATRRTAGRKVAARKKAATSVARRRRRFETTEPVLPPTDTTLEEVPPEEMPPEQVPPQQRDCVYRFVPLTPRSRHLSRRIVNSVALSPMRAPPCRLCSVRHNSATSALRRRVFICVNDSRANP